MANILYSIIIPTYNRPDNLPRAIESVLNQTFSNWELIIVDDNDPNSEMRQVTSDFMEQYVSDSRIKYLKHEVNQGGSAARSTGIKSAIGNYIAFLDDDDKWENNKLELFAHEISKSDDSTGVWFSAYYIVNDDMIFRDYQPKSDGYIYHKQFIEDNVSPTSSVVVKKECFDKVGTFDSKLPARQDYDMWIRISKYYHFKYIDIPLTYTYRESNHEAIGSSYLKSINGTERILSKLQDEIKSLPKHQQNRIYSRQYWFMGKRCCDFEEYSLGRSYFFKSLKYQLSFKTIGFLLLSYMGKVLWNILLMIKRKKNRK